MKSNRFASLIVLSLVLQVAALPAEAASPQPPLFSFLPNQLAAAAWYRPGDPPRLINGHLDSSFGQREVWPRLRENLKQARGTFAINAAEIGHLSSTAGLLPLLGDQEELRYEGGTLRRYSKPRAAANVLYENTLVAIVQFLRGSGIYEQGMQMRVGSWSHRPYETGSQVDEKTPGSMAHAANAIVKLL